METECQRLSAKCKELEVKYEESIGKPNYLENHVIPNLLERLDALEASVHAIEQLWEISHNEIHVSDDIIGSGGWGILQAAVYKGQNIVAKKMHKEVISQHIQNQLVKQIQIMAKCHHKNLVQFIGAVLEEPVIIVMELMQCTLRNALRKGNILPQHIQSVCLDVAEGLCYLHNIKPQPIIHGDVSPTNVLLKATDDGWIAKLSDFSCTKFAYSVQACDPGAAVYSAPEATTPPSQQTVKVDVYSYGILLVEVLTKEIPADNIVASLRSFEANWPDYVAVGRTCISDSPDHRPSMINVHIALSNISI